MLVAVTGASGHVGANLCRALIRKGNKVRGFSLNNFKSLEELNMEIIHGDVNDPDAVDKLVSGADMVVHLAAVISISGKHREEIRKVNVDGTRNVIEAAKRHKVKKFIHFSSIHSLDHYPQDQPMDETRPLLLKSPLPYEETKAEAERMVREAMAGGFPAIIINPTSILGPNDFKPSLMGQVLIKIYKGTIPALIEGGYDWVDVRDICQATVVALERGKPGERYILSGKWVDLKSLSIEIQDISGRRTPKTALPVWVARLGVPFMGMLSAIKHETPLYTYPTLQIIKEGNRHISHTKASKDLGFNPRPLRETLADTIEWFKKNNYI